MSKSIPGSGISVVETKEEIQKTIKGAYCPEKQILDNPILQITKLIILPRISEFKISRPEKFGGDVSYFSYENLEKDFADGKLHPADLKNALTFYLEEIISPIRKNFKYGGLV